MKIGLEEDGRKRGRMRKEGNEEGRGLEEEEENIA